MTNVKKKQKLRNNEYYNLQETFDELYAKSKRNYIFTKLMNLITSRENIQLAYRNLKKNDGSYTAGVDGKNIEYLQSWEMNFVYTTCQMEFFVLYCNLLNLKRFNRPYSQATLWVIYPKGGENNEQIRKYYHY